MEIVVVLQKVDFYHLDETVCNFFSSSFCLQCTLTLRERKKEKELRKRFKFQFEKEVWARDKPNAKKNERKLILKKT